MRKINRDKVLAAQSPYRELFGTDSKGGGRPTGDTEPTMPLPVSEALVDSASRVRFANRIGHRAARVIKNLYLDEFAIVYRKEMALAIAELERSVEEKPATKDRRKRKVL